MNWPFTAYPLIEWCVVHNARFGDYSECDRPGPDDGGESTCRKYPAVIIPVQDER